MRESAWRRRTAALAWVVGATLFVPGCVLSVGSDSRGGGDDRVERLERRIADAERRLGIDSSSAAHATTAAPAPEPAATGEGVR